jgi:hypothetical protein
VFTSDIIRKHEIEAGTAHTFQGDERDIMLLSFTLAPNSHFQSVFFAQKPNLFNVAVTRARKKLLCYISRPPETLPDGLLRNYLEYIQNADRQFGQSVDFEANDPIKNEMKELLQEAGLNVQFNTEIGGYPVSFFVAGEKNAIILEPVGFEGDKRDFSSLIEKHTTLERCGWKLVYITAREWSYSKKACINKIKAIL